MSGLLDDSQTHKCPRRTSRAKHFGTGVPIVCAITSRRIATASVVNATEPLAHQLHFKGNQTVDSASWYTVRTARSRVERRRIERYSRKPRVG